MLNLIKRFVKEEEGATMVEYALMIALIAVVCIIAVTALGDGAYDAFNASAVEIQAVPATPTAGGATAD